MQHRHHSEAFALHIARQIQHLHLVRNVQVGGGLVQQYDGRLLRQHQRHPYALPLAARQLVHKTIRKFGHAGTAHGVVDGFLILLRPLTQHTLVWIAPAADEVLDNNAFWGDGRLWQQAQAARHFLGLIATDGITVEENLAGFRLEHTGKSAKQGRFTATVGADDDGKFAFGNSRVNLRDNGVATIADVRLAGFQAGIRRVSRRVLRRIGRCGSGVNVGVRHAFSYRAGK